MTHNLNIEFYERMKNVNIVPNKGFNNYTKYIFCNYHIGDETKNTTIKTTCTN